MSATMTNVERVLAVIRGDQPDRPPVSFWYHFPPDQHAGKPAVDAHLNHLRTFDVDFVKIMFDLGYPTPVPIQTVADLKRLDVLNGEEGVFGEHLKTIESLARELAGRIPTATTIFNAWAVLRNLVKPPDYVPSPSMPPEQDTPTRSLEAFLAEDRQAVQHAVDVIARSLARFAARCVKSGADGIFLSVRDDRVDTPANGPGTYDQIVREGDLAICHQAGAARFNLLHVCGHAVDFAAFAEYPVHAINWADRSAGPTIADVAADLKPAPCAGLDQIDTLPNGSPDDCARQVADALTQAGDRPILIAPGCTYDPNRVPIANLKAVRQAVEIRD